MLNQPAPYSQEAEEATIGSILIRPGALALARLHLQEDDFFFVRHQMLFRAMVALEERGDPIDYMTVAEELKQRGHLEEIGGPAFLTQLINATPTAVHVEVYARTVQRAAERRRLMAAADEIKGLAADESLTTEEVRRQADAKVTAAISRPIAGGQLTLYEEVNKNVEAMEEALNNPQPNGLIGIPTGIQQLDETFHGLVKGKFYLVGGATHHGKTASMMTFALNAAKSGARVAYIDVADATRANMTARLIAMEGGFLTTEIEYQRLRRQDINRYMIAAERVSKLPLFLYHKIEADIYDIGTWIKHKRSEEGIDLVFVDYLQNIATPPAIAKLGRPHALQFVVNYFKKHVEAGDIAVIMGSQLKPYVGRPTEQTEHRHSNAAFVAADVIMYPHVPYRQDNRFPGNLMEIDVLKNKIAPSTGIAKCEIQKSSRLVDWTLPDPIAYEWERERGRGKKKAKQVDDLPAIARQRATLHIQ